MPLNAAPAPRTRRQSLSSLIFHTRAELFSRDARLPRRNAKKAHLIWNHFPAKEKSDVSA
jgi:hypothetical protein